jgi:hypothetical protein
MLFQTLLFVNITDIIYELTIYSIFSFFLHFFFLFFYLIIIIIIIYL